MDDPENLKHYLKAVIAIDPLDSECKQKVKNLKEKYRLSPLEREQLYSLSLNHRKRAKDFIKEGKEHGAIVELQRACDIDPLSIGIRDDLSQIHIDRWNRIGHKRDRFSAIKLINEMEALKANPKIIKDLRLGLKIKTKKKFTSKKKFFIIALSLFFTFGVLLIASGLLKSNKEQSIPPSLEEQGPEIVDTSFIEDYPIKIYQSKIEDLESGYAFNLSGSISNSSNIVSKLILQMNYIDSDKNPLDPILIPVIEENSPPLWPGEEALISHFTIERQEIPDISKIFLQIYEEESTPQASQDLVLNPVKTVWLTTRPAGISFTINEKEKIVKNVFDGSLIQTSFRITDTGTKAISFLKIEQNWTDAEGNEICKSEKIIINPEDPPLHQGIIRQFYTETPMEASMEDYYLTITQIN